MLSINIMKRWQTIAMIFLKKDMENSSIFRKVDDIRNFSIYRAYNNGSEKSLFRVWCLEGNSQIYLENTFQDTKLRFMVLTHLRA